MTKVAVFGPSGMLGRQVCQVLGDDAVPVYDRIPRLLDNLNELRRKLDGCDSIINCMGVIPTRNTTLVEMCRVNAEFPHVLTSLGLPTVLVSTDCVFSGRSRNRYLVSDVPDPRDYYGKSKAYGEVVAPNVCVVRTSFIGCDHGLLSWIMQAGTAARVTGETVEVDGFKNALWTGSTVGAVAHELVKMVGMTGVQHLATERTISKFDLLVKLVEVNELNIRVKPAYYPIVNRALQATVTLPNIDDALRDYPCRQLVAV